MSHAVLPNDLALLSLLVAREIDRKLGKRPFDRSIFNRFRNELSNASVFSEAHSNAFLSVDPITTELFAQAIRDASESAISDLESLRKAIEKIAEPLEDNGMTAEQNLPMLKAFCLALHRALMTHRLPPLVDGDTLFENELRFC